MGRRLRGDRAGNVITHDQENELVMGPDLATALANRHDERSLFESDAHRQRAWEAHRARLGAPDPADPGKRPWAFWRYDAERPELLRGFEEGRIERVALLAGAGYLSDAEIEVLREHTRKAQERIDTGEERGTLLEDEWCPNTGDRLAVRIGEAMEAALEGSPDG